MCLRGSKTITIMIWKREMNFIYFHDLSLCGITQYFNPPVYIRILTYLKTRQLNHISLTHTQHTHTPTSQTKDFKKPSVHWPAASTHLKSKELFTLLFIVTNANIKYGMYYKRSTWIARLTPIYLIHKYYHDFITTNVIDSIAQFWMRVNTCNPYWTIVLRHSRTYSSRNYIYCTKIL